MKDAVSLYETVHVALPINQSKPVENAPPKTSWSASVNILGDQGILDLKKQKFIQKLCKTDLENRMQ